MPVAPRNFAPRITQIFFATDQELAPDVLQRLQQGDSDGDGWLGVLVDLVGRSAGDIW